MRVCEGTPNALAGIVRRAMSEAILSERLIGLEDHKRILELNRRGFTMEEIREHEEAALKMAVERRNGI